MKKEKLMKKWNLTERDYNLIIELYEHLGISQKDEEWTNESIDNDLDHDWLTDNTIGKQTYYIYIDNCCSGYINKKTKKVCTEDEKVEKLLGAADV